MELTVGRLVHMATRQGTLSGEWVPACRAALVIEDLGDGAYMFGVFDRYGMNAQVLAYDEDKSEATWHWPEPAALIVPR